MQIAATEALFIAMEPTSPAYADIPTVADPTVAVGRADDATASSAAVDEAEEEESGVDAPTAMAAASEHVATVYWSASKPDVRFRVFVNPEVGASAVCA